MAGERERTSCQSSKGRERTSRGGEHRARTPASTRVMSSTRMPARGSLAGSDSASAAAAAVARCRRRDNVADRTARRREEHHRSRQGRQTLMVVAVVVIQYQRRRVSVALRLRKVSRRPLALASREQEPRGRGEPGLTVVLEPVSIFHGVIGEARRVWWSKPIRQASPSTEQRLRSETQRRANMFTGIVETIGSALPPLLLRACARPHSS